MAQHEVSDELEFDKSIESGSQIDSSLISSRKKSGELLN